MLSTLALATASGVSSYVFWFSRGEHHLLTTTYVQLFVASFVGGIVALTNFSNWPALTAFGFISSIFGCFLLGAYTSCIIYRLFLAPINKFPGPWQAKISALWFMTTTPLVGHYYDLERLHKKYGKYVRIGPNDLSIIDANGMEPSFAKTSKVTKGAWYDGSKPWDSMHSTRDPSLHATRRRFWAPGFNDKALRDYEQKVWIYNNKLVGRIREFRGAPIDMQKWFNLYGFDVMGQLAFGRDYNMLGSGERHWAMDLLTDSMSASPPKPPLWLFRLLVAIPGLAPGFHKFLKFCTDELKWRVEHKPEHNDITSWLLKPYKDWAHPEDDPMLQADTRLIVVAGSDTTSATLTYLFYELAKRPEEVKKLREELRPLTKGDWSDKDIARAQHLNGAINEALRLHPPVPSGLQRMTPPEGIQFGDTFVPGNVYFWMPQYLMGRGKSSISRESVPDADIYLR